MLVECDIFLSFSEFLFFIFVVFFLNVIKLNVMLEMWFSENLLEYGNLNSVQKIVLIFYSEKMKITKCHI